MRRGHDVTADVVLDRLYQATRTIPRGSDTQKSGRCPAHDDRNASLSIRLLPDKVLLNCHAMCAIEDVLAALDLTEADLFNQPPPERDHAAAPRGNDTWMPCTRDGHQRVAEYLYTDEQGTIEFGVCRCDHKCFRQWRVDPTTKSGRRWKLRDDAGNLLVRPRPYRLPAILAAIAAENVIWICEGEKDVEALVDRGFEATCNSGGSGNWTAEHAGYLTGADVTLVADRDKAGRKHAELVVETLRGIARSVYVVQARHGKDAFDHFAGGGTSGDFLQVWAPIPYPGDPAGGAA
jgi:5S rRNA maturation endonuclease (ribonuclease M5)